MGDSRISISVKLDKDQVTNVTNTFIVHLSADSPITDVVSHIKAQILPQFYSGEEFRRLTFATENSSVDNANTVPTTIPLLLYDCTLNPPVDITPKIRKFNQSSGPNSITLLSLNWFPSAKLVVIPANDEKLRQSIFESNIHLDDDYQYNKPKNATNVTDDNPGSSVGRSVNKPLIKGHNHAVLPSQVLQAARNRFEESDASAAEESSTGNVRGAVAKMNSLSKKRLEEERKRKIDARLKKLDESMSKKQSKVSLQVKKMLIKSRAEGDKKIRVEDRFFLETVLIDDSNSNVDGASTTENSRNEFYSTHRYFSTASNVGKILSCTTKNVPLGNDKMAELLVSVKENGNDAGRIYRRLQNTMRIYEAQKGGYLSTFDRVVVRIYSTREDISGTNSFDNSTPLVGSESATANVDVKVSMSSESGHDESNVTHNKEALSNNVEGIEKNQGDCKSLSLEQNECYKRIHSIVSELDLKDKTRKKKKTASTEKVRQILMKGKAKGKKTIPDKDRFYLEIVSVRIDSMKASTSSVYLSKFDTVQEAARILQLKNDAYSILVEGDGPGCHYDRLSKDSQCIDSGLKPFQRILFLEH